MHQNQIDLATKYGVLIVETSTLLKIYEKLWKQLIDEDMMKKDLQQKAGISWATMTKMSKGEVVSTEVLMKVCKVLHCDVGDIVEFIDDGEVSERGKN